MKKNKFFSSALFKENLRRFWPVSAVGLFIYFLSGPFLILTRSVSDNYMYGSLLTGSAASAMLRNLNFGFLMMHLVLPVVAAVCVFSYLNKVGSVAALHSMPFSRRTLYVTNYLSGAVLCVLPLVVNWALLSLCGSRLQSFTAGALGMWLFESFAIVFFVFSVAVLACIVSGNTVIATLTGFALNFLAAAVWVCMYAYAENFLYGFAASDIWPQVAYTNPWLLAIYCAFSISTRFTVWHCLAYIAAAIVISIAADILYHVRKLERCTDSYVFGWMQTIIGFLFAFVFSTMTGLVLFRGIGVWAYVTGFVIGFVIGQMVSLKTFRIFGGKCLRNLVIFAVLMALIIGAFALDVFGFEKKVPDPKDVETVSIEGLWTASGYKGVTLKAEDSIQNAVALHKEILQQHQDDVYEIDPVRHSFLRLYYKLKNGNSITREYALKTDYLLNSETYNRLNQSAEIFDAITGLGTLEGEKYFSLIREFPCSAPSPSEPGTINLSGADGEKLLKALISDAGLGRMTAAWARQPLYTAELTVMREFPDRKAAEDYFSRLYGYVNTESVDGGPFIGRFSFSISGDCEETLAFLESAGCGMTDVQGSEWMTGVIFRSQEAEGNNIYWLDHVPQSADGIAVLSQSDTIRAAAAAGYAGKASESCRWMSVCDTSDGACNCIYTLYIDIEKLPADLKAAVEPYVK